MDERTLSFIDEQRCVPINGMPSGIPITTIGEQSLNR
jgi:hypothetical protein